MKIRINGKVYDSIPGDSNVFKIGDTFLTRVYDGEARPRWVASTPFGRGAFVGKSTATPGGAMRSLRATLAR